MTTLEEKVKELKNKEDELWYLKPLSYDEIFDYLYVMYKNRDKKLLKKQLEFLIGEIA